MKRMANLLWLIAALMSGLAATLYWIPASATASTQAGPSPVAQALRNAPGR